MKFDSNLIPGFGEMTADEKVRDTHQYLEGMTVGIDEDFWTYDNDHASAPGMFEFAENNVNCRCELLFS